MGTFVAERRTTASYKNHKVIIRPEDEWVVIENHHPPLVSADVYDTVQRLCHNRRRLNRTGTCGTLSGLIFCSDCGRKLALETTSDIHFYYICSGYRSAGYIPERKCTRHSVRQKDIEAIVLSKIRETVKMANEKTAAFSKKVYDSVNSDVAKSIKTKSIELSKSERRIAELDKFIKRIYEDNVVGKLSDDRFQKMMAEYESEQSVLENSVKILKTELSALNEKTVAVESFIKLAKQYSEIPELTPEIARSFVEKIIIHEPIYKEGSKRIKLSQEIHIYLTYIGEFNNE
jgi:ssDNA-binding Zn-finger/Zn-ribbon topoisomerase 1